MPLLVVLKAFSVTTTGLVYQPLAVTVPVKLSKVKGTFVHDPMLLGSCPPSATQRPRVTLSRFSCWRGSKAAVGNAVVVATGGRLLSILMGRLTLSVDVGDCDVVAK